MPSLKATLIAQGYTEHNISISKKSGHLLTKVLINGQYGRFIIDTGASATCVDQSKAIKYQLKTVSMDKEIGTASGSLIPRMSLNNRLELGAWIREDTTLLSMDMTYINNALKAERMRSIQGLLGADLLIASKAIIDYKSKKIYLKGTV